MENVKMICFDMDGTIADLYSVDNWLEQLRAYNPAPYENAKPMWDMSELAETLILLAKQGIEIRIITWVSAETTPTYTAEVRNAKMEWLKKYDFPFSHFHGVQYGTTKANCVRKYLAENETAILIDDNKKVRDGWHLGETIDPTEKNIVEILKNLLTDLE